MPRPRIYLDHHATTPVDPRVVATMVPCFTEAFGNPASGTHAYGWEAERWVRQARAEVASLVNARSPREIVFTSGATESNNLALRGVFEAAPPGAPFHVITTAIEHPSVSATCAALERLGAEVSVVGVGRDGRVRPEAIEAALRPHTRLVSVMAVNNEVGTVQPLTAIGGLARAHGALFHCDAAQAAGRIALDVQRDGIDLLSLSAHKLYGPKGVGALYVRRRTPLAAQLTGGGQEGALRPGTLNVPGIVGLGEAARLAAEGMADETARQGALRDDLLRRLEAGLGPVALHGCRTHRVAGNLSLTIPGVKGGDLLAALPEIAMSAGSACMSAKGGAASPVLRAINVPEAQAAASLRIGLGRFTTEAEVVVAAERIVAAALRLRRRGRAKSCRA